MFLIYLITSFRIEWVIYQDGNMNWKGCGCKRFWPILEDSAPKETGDYHKNFSQCRWYGNLDFKRDLKNM
jgi:hypothetical protein